MLQAILEMCVGDNDSRDPCCMHTGLAAESQSRVLVTLQQRQAEFTSYKDYIGMDITSLVSLPVWIMEPFTILQRLAEIMEYTEQLDTAAGTEDEYERWVIRVRP